MGKKPIKKIYILHGWTSNASLWQKFLEFLSQSNLSAELILLPGLTKELGEVWDLSSYADWLEKLLSRKKNLILLGHSFGGKLAVKYCARNQEKMNKLILIDSSGIPDDRLHKKLKVFVFRILAKTGKIVTQNEKLRKLLYKIAGEKDYLEASPQMRKTMAKIIRENVEKDLAKIKTDTLIIWGEEDTVTPVFMAKKMHQLLENSELRLIARARHSPQFTQTQEAVNIIKEFIG